MDIRAVLLYGLTATHARLLRCLEDLTDDEARRTPHGLTPIIWQAGHIALADAGFARRADGRTEPPAGYEGLFATGTGGPAAYPPLAEVRDAVNRGQGRLEEIARTADLAARVDARNYSTVGEMLAFATYHRGYHVGKITTLRALLGKPRLFG
ncbi:MAG: DinB family protein [Armatimonadota bacterium]|nr:DinB family protein [Armatimonadota bacterium]MDR7486997.1 DinB family protein [Armatimonadota bacterium]MDR7531732.1 DinB family protein [Armatimonadota bacterium]MDR7534924.1 DinB family protein [Armatimonadota bacterium]